MKSVNLGERKAVRFEQKSANRVEPSCEFYGKCGGCQMQHIPVEMQREIKQSALFRRLQKLQKTEIDFQPMIVGEDKGYRRRVKLSVAWQKNQLVVGFREANSKNIVPISHCEMLEKALSDLFQPLQRLLANWKKPKQIGHIELVKADNQIAQIVMLFRHIGKLNQTDETALNDFAKQFDLILFVETEKGQIENWRGEQPYYQIDDLTLHFSVRDFIQVNADLNQKMVTKALEWLELDSQDRVLDLFCGMGNFTLPIAKNAKEVVGIEGVELMVKQAQRNAQQNQIENAFFYQTNLDEPFNDQEWASQQFNKVLLDPARGGAFFALDHLCELNPERIVYISCNPATLVRDAEKLIQSGYQLKRSAMIDMFPHTGHLESISLFEK